MREFPQLRNWLSAARLPWLAALAAAVLCVPSLRLGLNLDDFGHQVWLRGRQAFPQWESVLFSPRGPIDLFAFIRGEPAQMQALLDRGVVPWWTLPTLRLSFFRPLTALTHLADYTLWPNSPVLMHLQSLAWLAGSVILVALIYRRALGMTVACGLAMLFFAIDDAHAQPAAWIANRNSLVALFFGAAAILAHLRAAGAGRWPWRVLAAACLAASLLAAEAGVGAFGYLVAAALFLETGSIFRRTLGLLPYVAVGAVWRFAYVHLGYGAYGSGFYFDASSEPLTFLAALARHAPVNLLAQWAAPPAEVYFAGWEWGFWTKLVTAGVVFTLVLAVMLYPLVRRDARARFLAAGMLLSLAPACMAFPMDRLLLFVGIGAHGLAGMFIAGLWEHAEWRSPRRSWRVAAKAFAALLILVHLVVAPLALVVRCRTMFRLIGADLREVAAQLPARATDPSATIVLVNPHMAMDCAYLPLIRTLNGMTAPAAVRLLGPASDGLTVSRPDASTLVMDADNGFLRGVMDQLYRGPQHRYRAGDEAIIAGMKVEVRTVTPDGRPAKVAFHFDRPLDAPNLVWLRWQQEGRGGRYVEWTPPTIGQAARVTDAAPAS